MNFKKIVFLAVNISVMAVQAMTVNNPPTLQTLACKASIGAILIAMETQQTWDEELTHISCLGFPHQELLITELRSYTNDYLPWELEHTFDKNVDNIFSARFSYDNQLIVTTSWNGITKVLDAATFEPIDATPPEQAETIGVANFSPDGQQLATTLTKVVTIWNATTFELIHTLLGHTRNVNSVHFSPDGKLIVTASADNTTKIWNVATGATVQTLVGHTGQVWSAQFSHNGQKIVTASWDKTAKIWSKGIVASHETNSQQKLLQLLLQAKLYSLKKHKVQLQPVCLRHLNHIWQTFPQEHQQRLAEEYLYGV